jgi:hypothetical protein
MRWQVIGNGLVYLIDLMKMEPRERERERGEDNF